MIGALSQDDPQLIVIVIPIYQPGPLFSALVRQVRSQLAQCPLIIVDDGSGATYQDYFTPILAGPNCFLLQHSQNLGKGQALKTAFAFLLQKFPLAVGVVTVDGDGQHQIEDIKKIHTTLLENPHSLILGARQFVGQLPLRSKIGNQITRKLFTLVTNKKIQDTQTGLRGIPRQQLPGITLSPTERYALEMEMLFLIVKEQIPIIEVPTATLYLEGNRSSHFRPLIDSMCIYHIFFKFLSPIILPILLDFILFWQFYRCQSLSLAFWGAKTISLLFMCAITPRQLARSKRNLLSGLLTFGLLLLNEEIQWFSPLLIKMGGELFLSWQFTQTQEKS